MTGGKEHDFIVIDDFVEPGNKEIAVTGNLEFYGKKKPTPAWTRLLTIAKAGSLKVEIDTPYATLVDWAIGDEIVLGPSNYSPTELEKRKITNIEAIVGSGKTRLYLD